MPPDGAADAGSVVAEENTGGMHDWAAGGGGAWGGGVEARGDGKADEDVDGRTEGDGKAVGAAGLAPQPASNATIRAAPSCFMTTT